MRSSTMRKQMHVSNENIRIRRWYKHFQISCALRNTTVPSVLRLALILNGYGRWNWVSFFNAFLQVYNALYWTFYFAGLFRVFADQVTFTFEIHYYIISYIAVAMYSRDRYEIIRLREISHFIKQPCRNVCLEKAL